MSQLRADLDRLLTDLGDVADWNAKLVEDDGFGEYFSGSADAYRSAIQRLRAVMAANEEGDDDA